MTLSVWSLADLPIQRWEHYPKVNSTNTVAREWAAGVDDDQLPLLVTCDWQTAGRGRGAKVWTHEPGNLAFSLVTHSIAGSTPWMAFWTAKCLHQTAHHFLPDQTCTLKWPNDLMIEGRKNAGILIESVGPRLRMITGIGLNLKQPTSEIENGQDVFAWSDSGREFDICQVLSHFLSLWLPLDWQTPASQRSLLEYFTRCDHLTGQTVEVEQAGNRIRGRYAGLSPQGFLQLIPEDCPTENGPLTIVSCDRVRGVEDL